MARGPLPRSELSQKMDARSSLFTGEPPWTFIFMYASELLMKKATKSHWNLLLIKCLATLQIPLFTQTSRWWEFLQLWERLCYQSCVTWAVVLCIHCILNSSFSPKPCVGSAMQIQTIYTFITKVNILIILLFL